MEGDHLEDAGVDGRIILKPMLNKVGGSAMNSYGSRLGQIVGFCKHSNDQRGSIKCGEIPE
jgi:hypothetical protein